MPNPMTPAEQAREALEKCRDYLIRLSLRDDLIEGDRYIEVANSAIVALSALAPAADEVRLKVRWDGDRLYIGNFYAGFIQQRAFENTWTASASYGAVVWDLPTRDAARAALLEKVGA